MNRQQLLKLIHDGALFDSCLHRIERQLDKLRSVDSFGYEITLEAWEKRHFTKETFFRFIWDENDGFKGDKALINLYN